MPTQSMSLLTGGFSAENSVRSQLTDVGTCQAHGKSLFIISIPDEKVHTVSAHQEFVWELWPEQTAAVQTAA